MAVGLILEKTELEAPNCVPDDGDTIQNGDTFRVLLDPGPWHTADRIQNQVHVIPGCDDNFSGGRSLPVASYDA